MTELGGSDRVDAKFVSDRLDTADPGIPQRDRTFQLVRSFYTDCLGRKEGRRMLEPGCGDGAFAQALLSLDRDLTAALADGSREMLSKAKLRFRDRDGVDYPETTFEEPVRSKDNLLQFDLVVSSPAIHHLPLDEKKALFRYIYAHLNEGGYFINIDPVLPPSNDLEAWYLKLWEEWLTDRCLDRSKVERFVDQIYDHHMAEEHHRNLDTMPAQLRALQGPGYREVDCIFKEGVPAVYCGKRPG